MLSQAGGQLAVEKGRWEEGRTVLGGYKTCRSSARAWSVARNCFAAAVFSSSDTQRTLYMKELGNPPGRHPPAWQHTHRAPPPLAAAGA